VIKFDGEIDGESLVGVTVGIVGFVVGVEVGLL